MRTSSTISDASRRLLRLTWIIEALALSAPILSLMPDWHPDWAQNQFFFFLIAPLALLFFLLYLWAKLFFVPLTIVVCAVILRSDIPGRTKVVAAVLGGVAYLSLVHWSDVLRHMW